MKKITNAVVVDRLEDLLTAMGTLVAALEHYKKLPPDKQAMKISNPTELVEEVPDFVWIKKKPPK